MSIATPIERIQQILSEILHEEWEAQGHRMTGKVIDEIDYIVKQETNKITLTGMMFPYGAIITYGTSADKIPFSGRSGKGGTSKYIQGLQKYVQLRMNIEDQKKSLSIAFAIAHTQKKEGMPTKKSYDYTSTGKRTEFIADAIDKNEDKIIEAVREMTYNILSLSIDALTKKWNIILNQK